MAVGLRQLGPSEAESSGHAFESVDDVSFDERIKPDGVAGQFVDDVVGLVKRLAEGVGVDVARRGLVDESPHILHIRAWSGYVPVGWPGLMVCGETCVPFFQSNAT